MAPKRIRTVGGGAFDARKFISAEVEAKYNLSLEYKKFIHAREFRNPRSEVGRIILERDWKKFVEQPISIIQSVIGEFYDNAKEHQNFKVFIRGKTISFNSISINRILETLNFEGDEYTVLYDIGIDFEDDTHLLLSNYPNA